MNLVLENVRRKPILLCGKENYQDGELMPEV
jgi:hypothetical protein